LGLALSLEQKIIKELLIFKREKILARLKAREPEKEEIVIPLIEKVSFLRMFM
jgi:hypothetical protein